MPNTNVQKNLDGFLSRYGKEGVLVLYFSNLLEDLVRGEFLHTLDSDRSSSPGILEYSDREGRFLSSESLNQRAKELRRECELRAIGVVNRLHRRGYLDKFGTHELQEGLVIEQVNSQLKEIFKEVFGVEWGIEV